MLLNLFNARLETLKPVPVRDAEIDMRMKSLYRLWLMNGGSAVPINGYHVPAGTQVMVNIWKLHQDPRVWSDPCQFRPERFLTSHVGVEPRGQHFEYIPFGSGRRSCPGISFALQVIHLVLAHVIHGFDLAVPTDAPFKTAQAQAQAWSLGSPKSDPIKVHFNPRLSPELYN
ncbi:hypothetical protein MRB53_014682 [Persea americana]|uniref:Uncharacterized protein n=1 Tax=Persea americana TaxID=3435 RepID=A0ACC2KBQ2_PERAE|nr:hypothetical protein MRB53_014682 [Persea americana]